MSKGIRIHQGQRIIVTFGPPPKGYIPGIGRNAVGFTTAPDLGSIFESKASDDSEAPDLEYTSQDQESDIVWDAIDTRSAKKKNRKQKESEESDVSKHRTIKNTFSEYIDGISTLSEDQWVDIPEAQDFTSLIKKKKINDGRLYSATTFRSLQLGGGESDFISSRIKRDSLSLQDSDPQKFRLNTGVAKGEALATSLQNIQQLDPSQKGPSREDLLMTLNQTTVLTDQDVSDIKETTQLMNSMLRNNPKNPNSWIMAARTQEVAGKKKKAIEIIFNGTKACPKSADIWIEAFRLVRTKQKEPVLAQSLKHLPRNERIWQTIVDFKQSSNDKRKMLKQALKMCPKSVSLWKHAISLEVGNSDKARTLILKAIPQNPHSIDLWMALTRVVNYKQAKQALSRAQRYFETDISIWIAALQLEDKYNQLPYQEKFVHLKYMVLAASKTMKSLNNTIPNQKWLFFAKECEEIECDIAARAIVHSGYFKKPASKLHINYGEEILSTAQSLGEDYPVVARSLFECLNTYLPQFAKGWTLAIKHEFDNGSPQSYENLLENAQKVALSQRTDDIAGILEIFLSKSSYHVLFQRPEKAKLILNEALLYFQQQKISPIPKSLYINQLTLYHQYYPDQLESLFESATQQYPKLFYQWILYHLQQKQFQKAFQLIKRGLKQDKTNPHLWNCLLVTSSSRTFGINWSDSSSNPQKETIKFAQAGIKSNATNATFYEILGLWCATFDSNLAQMYFNQGLSIYPLSENLWNARIHSLCIDSMTWLSPFAHQPGRLCSTPSLLEESLSQAVGALPKSGSIKSLGISYNPNPSLTKALLKNAIGDDPLNPYLLLESAKYAWASQQFDQARTFFQKALAQNPKFGDCWAYYFAFEKSLESFISNHESGDTLNNEYDSILQALSQIVGNENPFTPLDSWSGWHVHIYWTFYPQSSVIECIKSVASRVIVPKI